MDVGDFSAEVADIIDGFSSSLLEISPSAANRFRAGMSTVGNSALLSHSQSMAKLQQKREEISALDIMDQIIGDVPSVVSVGSRVDPVRGEIVSLADSIELERNRILSFGLAVSDPGLVERKLKGFDEAVEQAVVGAVSDWVLSDPLKHSVQLQTGNIEDAATADVWNNMTDQQKRAARKAAFDAEGAILTRESQLDAKLERVRRDRVDELSAAIFDAQSMGNQAEVDDLLMEMQLIDPGQYASTAATINTQGGVDNANSVSYLDTLAITGELTFSELNSVYLSRQISRSTFTRFAGVIKAQRDKRFTTATRFLANHFGNPEKSLMPGQAEQQAKKQIASIQNDLILEMDANPSMDPLLYVRNRIKEITTVDQSATAAQISEARTLLAPIAQQLNVDATDFKAIREGVLNDPQLRARAGELNDAMKILEAAQ